MNWWEWIKTMWTHEHHGEWVKACTILVAAVVLSFLIRFLLTGIVMRLTRKTKTEIDDKMLEYFKNPLTLSIMIGGVNQSVAFLTSVPDAIHLLVKRLLISLVVLLWFFAFMRFCNFLADWLGEKETSIVQPRTKPLFRMLFKLGIILAGAYFMILAWNLNVTGWLASAGVAGLALGFAAKDTLANLFAGVFIIADAPYKIGDYIVLGNGDRGRVTDIGIRSTRLVTRDDVEIIIPNAIIGNTEIINQSGGPYEKYRIRVAVGVAYGSDLDQVRRIMLEVAEAESLVMKEPEARIRMRAFGNSSLDHELLVWVEKPEFKGMALDNLLTDIYKAFGREGVEIPYPKRDVYLHQVTED